MCGEGGDAEQGVVGNERPAPPGCGLRFRVSAAVSRWMPSYLLDVLVFFCFCGPHTRPHTTACDACAECPGGGAER
eukprot:5664947-Prymnesium_polylepis.1